MAEPVLDNEDEYKRTTGANQVEPAAGQNVPEAGAASATPTGVIGSAIDYRAPEVSPITREVAAEETVEGRLNRLTSAESPYMTEARESAKRLSARRGLINTSMAAGAGEQAAIREARPIAEADARTMSEAAIENQRARNEFLRNRQSANLNIESAARASELARGEADWQNQLNMQRDTHSTDLNMSLSELESTLKMGEEKHSIDLKVAADRVLNNDKYSQEIKRMYVSTINDISKNAQQQIVDIGLSDRSAEAQAAAIEQTKINRDANIKVYEDLLAASTDWDWGTDFTPTKPAEPEPTAEEPAATEAEKRLSDVTKPPSGTPIVNRGYWTSSDGKWAFTDGKWVEVPQYRQD